MVIEHKYMRGVGWGWGDGGFRGGYFCYFWGESGWTYFVNFTM